MLYYLFDLLNDFEIPGLRLFNYISFRALLSAVISLLVSAWFGGKLIKFFKKKQVTETLRDFDKNNLKAGVPTMGGLIIIIAILVPCLLIGRLENVYMILLLITTVWLGALGFADDYIKTFKKNKDGIPGKVKIVAQVALGLVIGLTLCFSPQAVMRENITVNNGTTEEVQFSKEATKENKTTIPFVKDHNINYSEIMSFCGDYKEEAGWALFVIISVFVITAVSNGANLNDGMDGMLAGNAAIIGVTLAVLAYVSSHVAWAEYLNIMYIPGSGELAVFMSALVGALIGFLWYNSFPAQVFMGDTGSLMLGGIIGVCAVLIRKELLLPILCGIFFVESLSVIMQRFYFKYTKKKYGEGKRIFKMAPLHHHYQKEGIPALFTRPEKALPEAKIVTRFWIVGMILAVITIALLKVR